MTIAIGKVRTYTLLNISIGQTICERKIASLALQENSFWRTELQNSSKISVKCSISN